MSKWASRSFLDILRPLNGAAAHRVTTYVRASSRPNVVH